MALSLFLVIARDIFDRYRISDKHNKAVIHLLGRVDTRAALTILVRSNWTSKMPCIRVLPWCPFLTVVQHNQCCVGFFTASFLLILKLITQPCLDCTENEVI